MARNIFYILVIICPLLASAEACELNIGMILPLSGNAAQFGERTKNGAELAFGSRSDFMKNCQLQVFFEDSAWNASKAVSAYRSLVSRKNIDAVVTGASHVSLAVSPLAKEQSVIQIGIFTSAESYSSPDDLSLRLSPRARDDVSPFLPIIKKRDLEIGIIHIANDFGEEMADSFTDLLSQVNKSIILRSRFISTDSDFRTILLKMKKQQVSGLLLVGLPAHYAQILQQAHQIGYHPYFFSPRTAEDKSIARLGKLTEKLLYSNPFDVESKQSLASSFVETYKSRFKSLPDAYSAEGYESIRLLGKIWGECKGIIACVKSSLNDGSSHQSVFGALTFDQNGNAPFQEVVKHYVNGEAQKLQ